MVVILKDSTERANSMDTILILNNYRKTKYCYLKFYTRVPNILRICSVVETPKFVHYSGFYDLKKLPYFL